MMASANPMNSWARGLLAMFAIFFRRINKKSNTKNFSEFDGKHGTPFLRSCAHFKIALPLPTPPGAKPCQRLLYI